MLSTGDRLGPYEVISRLGAGGMGVVYRARDDRLKRDVALKVLHASLLTADHVQRLRREAILTGALNHPNIVVVHDVGTEGAVPYVVSELLEGETLRQRLDRGRVAYLRALEFGIQIATALGAAHEKGVLHRDVKPGNVFVTADGRIKLLDFGLAKMRQAEPRADPDDSTASPPSQPGHVLGTAGYMAPEQVLGEPVDYRTDIFALGAVLYEMLTGSRAFHRSSPIGTMNAVLDEEPADPLLVNPALPSAAAAVVRRCLEKKREERFQSARDLAFALQQLAQQARTGSFAPTRLLTRRRALFVTSAALAVLLAADLAARFLQGPKAATFRQLSFHRGWIGGARFASDSAVVYSQALAGDALAVWLTQSDAPESRELDYSKAGYAVADVLAARPHQVALSVRRRYAGGDRFVGSLAVAPLGGGAPREMLVDVEGADWGPSGDDLAVAFSAGVGAGSRLEYPAGRKTLYTSRGSIQYPRVSRDGRRVAFIEHPAGVGTAGRVVVVDQKGAAKVLTPDWDEARGLAWSPRGDEVWFASGEENEPRALRAVDLTGRQRLVLGAPGSVTIWDAAPNGRVLLSRDDHRISLVGVPPGEAVERDLSWFDASGLAGLSRDGRQVLFGDRFGVYLRPTDGSPPTKLGLGGMYADDLSPDGMWVLATTSTGKQLIVLPTGPGAPRPLPAHQITSYSGAEWFPDGRRILFNGREGPLTDKQELTSYVQDVYGGPPRALTNKGTWAVSLSRDGAFAAAIGPGHGIWIVPTAGGPPRQIPGSRPGERPAAWTGDDTSLWVYNRGEVPAHVSLVDIATGKRRVWKTLAPRDPAGVYTIYELDITAGGDAYFYSYRRMLSQLYVAIGLR